MSKDKINLYISQGLFYNVFVPKSLPDVELSEMSCCASISQGIISDKDALDLSLRLKALADPIRIKIIAFVLSKKDIGVRNIDLVAYLDLSDATISHHLKQLSKAGFLISERKGTSIYYWPRLESLGMLSRIIDPNCC